MLVLLISQSWQRVCVHYYLSICVAYIFCVAGKHNKRVDFTKLPQQGVLRGKDRLRSLEDLFLSKIGIIITVGTTDSSDFTFQNRQTPTGEFSEGQYSNNLKIYFLLCNIRATI